MTSIRCPGVQRLPDHDHEFASLAHDLSQLLWAIQGRARTLAADADPDACAALESIAEDAATAAAMLWDTPDGVASPVEIMRGAWRQAVDRAVAAGGASSAWQLEQPEDVPLVGVPPATLRRILANLLANALDAMPNGGVVTCTAATAAGLLRWQVRDSGPGIDPALRSRLFEPGATAGKVGGHGLGLAGARRLARKHGGDLELTEAGPGATFVLTVPLAENALNPSDIPVVSVDPTRELRVLVVDDDPAVRTMLAELLDVDGHRTHLAASADSALAEFTPDTYDAALIDLGLPGRSGLDLAAELRGLDRSLALILLTGWGREKELASADRDVVDLTAIKPVDQPVLRDLLNQAAESTARRRRANTEG